MTHLQLDHLFCFVEADTALADLGLTETYRRSHPGQGTANVCYCFDNAYLELLWVTDADELSRSALGRSHMHRRARWRETGASPFGIAVRRGPFIPWTTWDYRPPYLPELALPVSICGDDPQQPFLFVSPGQERPDQWSPDRAGDLQQPAGLKEILDLELRVPALVQPHSDVLASESAGLLRVTNTNEEAQQLVLTLSHRDGDRRRLLLPDFKWI